MKKSSTTKTIVYLFLTAALTAGGYWAGRQQADSASAFSPRHAPASTTFKGGKIATAKLNANNQSTLDDFLKLKGKPDAGELAAWVRGLSPEECAAALASLQSKPAGNPRDLVMDAIVKSWAGRDPQGFLSAADGLTSPRMREQGVAAALKAMAASNPQAALQWLKDNAGNGSTASQQARYSALIAGFAATDPAGAFALVSGMAEDTPANQRQKTQAMQAFITGLSDQGKFSDALTYVGQIADGPAKDQALNALAQNWAQGNPVEASTWIASLADPRQRNNLSNQLVAAWAGSDPAAAAAWASQMDLQSAGAAQDPNNPMPGGNANLLANVINNWAGNDLDAAGKYLNSLPVSSEKDGATASFALNAAAQDPAGAMNWVNIVSDPSMRERLALVTALEWQSVDAAGASQYVANSTLLTDDEKNLLANVPPFVTDMLTGNGGSGGGPGGFGGPGGGGPGGPGGGRGGPGGGPQAPAGGATSTGGVSQQVLNFVVSGSGANILTGGGPGGRGNAGGRGGRGGGG